MKITRRELLKNLPIITATAAATTIITASQNITPRAKGTATFIENTLLNIRETRTNSHGDFNFFLKKIDKLFASKIKKCLIDLHDSNVPIPLTTIRDFPLECYEYLEYRGSLKNWHWVEAAELSLEASRVLNDEYSLGVIYPQIANKIGLSYRMMDNYTQAIHYYELGLKHAIQAEELSDIHTNLCDVYRLDLKEEQALEHGKKALQIASDIPQKRAKALEYLGLLEHSPNKNFDASIAYLEEAVNLRREFNDPRLPLTISFLAVSLIARGSSKDLSLATDYIAEAYKTETDTGNRLANLQNLEGSAHLAMKRYKEADNTFSKCFETYRETNYDRGKVIANSKRLAALVGAKNLDEAALVAHYVTKHRQYLKPADYLVLNLANSYLTLYQEINAQANLKLFEIIDQKTILEETIALAILENNKTLEITATQILERFA